jgi:hypothetical protein
VSLGAPIALRRLDARLRVLAPAVVALISPQDRVLRALLVDEDYVYGDTGIARPRERWRGAAITGQVPPTDPFGNRLRHDQVKTARIW